VESAHPGNFLVFTFFEILFRIRTGREIFGWTQSTLKENPGAPSTYY